MLLFWTLPCVAVYFQEGFLLYMNNSSDLTNVSHCGIYFICRFYQYYFFHTTVPHVTNASHIHHRNVQFANYSESFFILGFMPHRFTSMASSAYNTSETLSVETLILTLVLPYLTSLLVYALFDQVAVSVCFWVHIKSPLMQFIHCWIAQ